MRQASAALTVRLATEADLDDIRQLNHQTFAGEIPQHAPRPDGRLVDRFEGVSTFIVVRDGDRLVGMCALGGASVLLGREVAGPRPAPAAGPHALRDPTARRGAGIPAWGRPARPPDAVGGGGGDARVRYRCYLGDDAPTQAVHAHGVRPLWPTRRDGGGGVPAHVRDQGIRGGARRVVPRPHQRASRGAGLVSHGAGATLAGGPCARRVTAAIASVAVVRRGLGADSPVAGRADRRAARGDLRGIGHARQRRDRGPDRPGRRASGGLLKRGTRRAPARPRAAARHRSRGGARAVGIAAAHGPRGEGRAPGARWVDLDGPP